MATKAITTLNKEIEDFLFKKGAVKVGFATLETLAGGPPSTDITYILPEAKSAINFALPFDKQKIRDFLAKKERTDYGVEGYENIALPGYNLHLTCGLCQSVCFGDPKETAEAYKMLTNAGCVIQTPGGDILALAPEEAEKKFNSFPRKHRRLYVEPKKL